MGILVELAPLPGIEYVGEVPIGLAPEAVSIMLVACPVGAATWAVPPAALADCVWLAHCEAGVDWFDIVTDVWVAGILACACV
ncbi:MAG TPA: hypothetical protein VK395_25980 [Gemmataceae bacterium]|nr:hypothetical protein [Gemmataceae bacterium]